MRVEEFKAIVKEAVKEAMIEIKATEISFLELDEPKPVNEIATNIAKAITTAPETKHRHKWTRAKTCPVCRGKFKNLTNHYKLKHTAARAERLELLARIRPKAMAVKRAKKRGV